MKKTGTISRFRPDWQALLICFGAAAAFWFFNAMRNTYTTSVAYPLEIRYDHAKYYPEEPLPNEIIFTATGTGWDLLRRKYRAVNEPLYINFDKIRQKNFITSDVLQPLLTQKLHGLKIEGFEEDTIIIRLSKLKTRKIRIKADISKVDFEDGFYATAEPRCNPGWITINGTSKQLKALPDTIWVHVSGSTDAAGNFSEKTSVQIPAEGLITDIKETEVTFQTTPHIKISREVNIKKVNFPSSNYELSDKTVTIEYYIEEKNKEKDAELPYVAIADYSKWNRSENQLTLRLQPRPSYVKGIRISPAQISLKH